MFEYSKKLMEKIENKEDLDLRELMIIEMSLRLYDCNEQITNYLINVEKNNFFEMSRTVADLKKYKEDENDN